MLHGKTNKSVTEWHFFLLLVEQKSYINIIEFILLLQLHGIFETMEKTTINEVLSIAGRLKKKRDMKRNKTRVKTGRGRAMRKVADSRRLKNRAEKHARNIMFKKFSRGKGRGDVSMAQKAEIEKKMQTPAMQQRIQRMSTKLFQPVRKMDRDRRKTRKSED